MLLPATDVERRRTFVPVVIAVGLAGSLAVAAGSYAVGAGRLHDVVIHRRHRRRILRTVLSTTHLHALEPVYFLGVFALCAAWLLLGRRVFTRQGQVAWRTVRRGSWLWALPLLFAVPVGSRDLWAYAGQGDVLRHGLDPYRYGPAAVRGGHYVVQVSRVWRHASSPYGPLWLTVSRIAVTISGSHVLFGVLLLRLVVAAGLFAATLALPRLCRAVGASPSVACWAFAANPLVLVLGLGGGHNDLLAGGLVLVALVVAVSRAPAWCSLGGSAALLTAAADVKLPALVALAFLPLVWLRYAEAAQGWRARPRALPGVVLVVLLVAAVTAAIVAASTGLGIGWVTRLNATDVGTAWVSVPVAVGLLGRYLRGSGTMGRLGTNSQPFVGKLALVLAILVLPTLWWLARRREPIRWLALAMLAAITLSTTVQPWYFIWPLVVGAVVPLRRGIWVALSAVAIGLTLAVTPSGSTVLNGPTLVPIAIIAGLASWLVLARGTTEPVRVRVMARGSS